MAITAKIGTTSSYPNEVIKTATLSQEWFSVDPTGTVDDLTCDFVLDGGSSSFVGKNYLAVKWGTAKEYFYFINQKTSMPGNRTMLSCEMDVLATFSSTITASPAVISRTSNANYVNYFLRDNRIPILSTSQISSDPFGPDILGTAPQEYIYVGIWQNGKAREASST